MKGDFTKLTFQPEKHYTSVRMQQGRLQLDSDWNEQVDIQNHLRHTQTVDLIGADSGVPTSQGNSENPYRDSFKISLIGDGTDLAIAPGRLYVNGTLCELEAGTLFNATIKASNRVEVSSLIIDGRPLEEGQWLEYTTDKREEKPKWLQIQTVILTQRELTFSNVDWKDIVGNKLQLRRLLTYNTQPEYPNPNDGKTLLDEGVYLAYIDAWQRHITAIEDSTIREVALNIPDTTTRTKTVWQLKLEQLEQLEENTESDEEKRNWKDFFSKHKIERRPPYLNACAKHCPSSDTSASRETGYRRLENQLYRVEIHDSSSQATLTFKWSRDNGSILSAIEKIEGNTIVIRKSSQDAWASSQTGQWIEITNEEIELKGKPGALAPLLRASDTKIEFDSSRIKNGEILSKATKVRRWEQIQEVTIPPPSDQSESGQSEWIDLEAGIKVKFYQNSSYKTGDYWLIPARSATNDIEWPSDQAKPTPQPLPQLPQGIQHDYCALALVKVNGGKFELKKDLRVIFPPLMRCLDKAGGTITGDLYVEGKVGIGKNPPDALLGVAGDVKISETTTTKNLKVEENANVTGLTTTKNLKVEENANVTGTTTTKNLKVEQDANVTETTTTKNLKVEKNATVTGLTTTKNLIVEENADVTRKVTTQSLEVQNNAALGNATANQITIGEKAPNATLGVDGDAIVTGKATANQITIGEKAPNATLGVDGDAIVTGKATANQIIIGEKAPNATLGVDGDAIVTGKATANQIIIGEKAPNATLGVDGDAIVTGKATANQIIIGEKAPNATLGVDGDAIVTGKATANQIIIGEKAPNATLGVDGDAIVTGKATANQITIGEKAPNATLGVDGDAIVTGKATANQIIIGEKAPNATLGVDGDAIVTGKATANQITIGEKAPNATLGVDGDAIVTGKATANQIIIGEKAPNATLGVDGDAIVTGKVTAKSFSGDFGFNQQSSRALKEDIQDLSSQEVAAILRSLNPVKFIYTEDESKTPHAGFIAEDTPDLLTANDKQAIKVVDIVAVLTKVVQDNRKTLSDLVKIVKKQQAEIATLTEKIKILAERTEQ